MTFQCLTTSQKIRASLHRDVRSICGECCHFIGLDITKPAMDVIAELTYKKLLLYAGDLEAFAKHAKRSTINTEDVKLLFRRNPSLRLHLSKIHSTNTTSIKPNNKEKHRKTNPVVEQTKVDQPNDIEMRQEIDNTTTDNTLQPTQNIMNVDTIDLTFEESQ